MIDKKIIDAHQFLIDVSERKPTWWAENIAWAYVAFGFIGLVLVRSIRPQLFLIDLFWTGIILIAGGAMVCISRVPAFFSMVGARNFIRAIFWVDLAMRIISLFSSAENWKVAYMINSALLLSYLYFCACKPPRPRKRRQASAQIGTA
jgi:hypothetical protein